MTSLHHYIEIACAPEQAYQIGLDVEHWPTYFTPCKHTAILHRTDTSMHCAISAEVQGQLLHWESERILDKENLTISFRQSKPSALVDSLQGKWRYYATTLGTLVTLEHHFSIKDKIDGLVDGITTTAEAHAFMTHCIRHNSQHELLELKQLLENNKDHPHTQLFSEKLLIPAATEAIFSYLRHAEEWPNDLDHCQQLHINYDDGYHQELIMTLKINDHTETIRSIRTLAKPYRIYYVQVQPPRLLHKHHGYWQLTPVANGVLVTAMHHITLNVAAVTHYWPSLTLTQARDRIQMTIASNSRATLQTMRQQLITGR